MIDYLISAVFAVLTTCGIVHLWFRTTAASEYIGLVSPAGAIKYEEWLRAKRGLWKDARKRAVESIPFPDDAATAETECVDCGKNKNVTLTPEQEQSENARKERSKKLREIVQQQRKAANAIRQPDLSVIAWLTETYPEYWIVRLLSCYQCLALPVAVAASLLFWVPAAAIAVYWVSLKAIEYRIDRGGENHA